MIYLTTKDWDNYVLNNSLRPEWTNNTQVSTCPGLMNYVTEGMVVLAPEDYEFETNDGDISHWNTNSEENIKLHHWYQADLYKPGYTIVKFNTGIMLRQDEKNRVFCVLSDYEPLDPSIKVMPAVFPLLDIWSPVMMNTVWPNGHHFVAKGEPLARIFISYAGNFEFKHEGKTSWVEQTKEWENLKKQPPSVLTAFNKEMKKCPFHHG